MNTTAENPEVSVCIVTYNQENYIRQCLQSVVDQKRNFEIEVIVSDDCSTDSTPKIIQEFANVYDFIVPVLHKKNIGALKNYFTTHNLARGMYVCHLDGDDYWHPQKLISQKKILDSHPEYSLSACAAQVINSKKIIGNAKHYPNIATVEDLLKLDTYFVNSSVMYRSCLREIEEPCIDFYSHVQLAIRGKVHLLKEPLCSYRIHNDGISKNPANIELFHELYIKAYMLAEENGIRKELIIKCITHKNYKTALSMIKANDIKKFLRYIHLNNRSMRHAKLKHKLIYITTKILPSLSRIIPFLLKVKSFFIIIKKLT